MWTQLNMCYFIFLFNITLKASWFNCNWKTVEFIVGGFLWFVSVKRISYEFYWGFSFVFKMHLLILLNILLVYYVLIFCNRIIVELKWLIFSSPAVAAHTILHMFCVKMFVKQRVPMKRDLVGETFIFWRIEKVPDLESTDYKDFEILVWF